MKYDSENIGELFDHSCWKQLFCITLKEYVWCVPVGCVARFLLLKASHTHTHTFFSFPPCQYMNFMLTHRAACFPFHVYIMTGFHHRPHQTDLSTDITLVPPPTWFNWLILSLLGCQDNTEVESRVLMISRSQNRLPPLGLHQSHHHME